MEKAACYVRVSTEEQARGGVSLDAQEDFVRNYCQMKGLEPIVLIDDGVSAGLPLCKRPAGRLLLEAVAGGVRHVVAYKLDRLFRDSIEANTKAQDWEKRGVVLHLLDLGGNSVNTGSAMGKFMYQIISACAELERNRIRERTTEALQFKKSRREVYGSIPLGFDRQGNRLEENPAEQEVIQQIRRFNDQGHSLRGIARRLNAAEVPTKRGARWYASTVRAILRNDLHGAL